MVTEKERKNELLSDTLKILSNSIKALNNLIPLFVLIFGVLLLWTIYLIIRNALAMMGITILVVMLTSIIIYAKSQNYGEAALSLVAGLLTAFSVEWTVGRFVAFVTAWSGFSLIVLMFSSVKIASEVEDIFRQASLNISMGTGHYRDIEEKLKKISDDFGLNTLGPVEKAKVIRLFCYKKVPIERIEAALHAVGTLSIITKVDYETISLFVADLYKASDAKSGYEYERLLDKIYITIRETPVPPLEFIEAFNLSRRLLFENQMELLDYFEALRDGLALGIVAENIFEYIVSVSGV